MMIGYWFLFSMHGAVYTGVYQNVDGKLETVIEDGYLPISELKDKLHALNQDYVYVGFNIENIAHLLDSEVIENLQVQQS